MPKDKTDQKYKNGYCRLKATAGEVICSWKLSEKRWRFTYTENILCIYFTFCWCTCRQRHPLQLIPLPAKSFGCHSPPLCATLELLLFFFFRIRFTSLWSGKKRTNFSLTLANLKLRKWNISMICFRLFLFFAILLLAANHKQKERVLFITFKALWTTS